MLALGLDRDELNYSQEYPCSFKQWLIFSSAVFAVSPWIADAVNTQRPFWLSWYVRNLRLY
jgi:hypothetical protein